MAVATDDAVLSEILRLRGEGVAPPAIADELELTRQTVNKWLARTDGRVCKECDTTLGEPVADSLCGFCREEAVLALADPSPAPTFAIWRLRELGHSAEAAVRAFREARRGAAPAEVVVALVGLAGGDAL